MAWLEKAVVFLCVTATLTACISGSSMDSHIQQELLDRIAALEQQGRHQSLTLKAQAESLLKMESRLDEQAEKLLSQEKTIGDYKVRVQQLERTVAELQTEKEAKRVGDDENRSQQVKRGMGNDQNQELMDSGIVHDASKQRRVLVNDEGVVAFHAVIKQTTSSIDHIGINQHIVFPDVMLNIGGGYHNLHGVFTAPRPGIYIFATSILSYSIQGHQKIFVHLVKNGQPLANVYAEGDAGHNDQGSVTVVTYLNAADDVWVSLYQPADASLWGDSFDSFTGCLLFPL